MMRRWCLAGTIAANASFLGIVEPASAERVAASRLLQPGTIIAEQDLRSAEPGTRSALPASAAIGREVVRRIEAGRPIMPYDLREPRAVRRGDPVTVVFRSPGLEITVTGRALADAVIGSAVRVQTSSRTLDAVAVGVSRVAVGGAS